ncbi:hypothetical protein PG994_003412 [Apiospora phragmitis]|uniref:Xylanolytic transcriptional activator regulatory domain-containing protein n=1 Tax=Apiospora phragmitis TaxID=2905665 RepID=A0ABR1VY02_9PEZI
MQFGLGYVAVLLAVCAISLEYITAPQIAALVAYEVEPEAYKLHILTTLKLRTMDVVSLGTLEAVQMCVVLGSYYLYHGLPELAWPICGCGLRIAQALNLHRKVPPPSVVGPGSPGGAEEEYALYVLSARRRCWWAVYEIETFCSTMYGFPLSVVEGDCDIEDLDPYDESSAATTHDAPHAPPNLDRQNEPITDQASHLLTLVKKVAGLEARLREWQECLTPVLRPVRLTDVGVDGLGPRAGVREPDENTDDNTKRIFRLQALVLKFAYENARILIHRPLLSYQVSFTNRPTPLHPGSRADPFGHSIHECCEATLQMSLVGCPAIRAFASGTYAVALISLHLFTAGVTLCIMASPDPLSPASQEPKLGVRRTMDMQMVLAPELIVASQGLGILRRLTALVMARKCSICSVSGLPPHQNESFRRAVRSYQPRMWRIWARVATRYKSRRRPGRRPATHLS